MYDRMPMFNFKLLESYITNIQPGSVIYRIYKKIVLHFWNIKAKTKRDIKREQKLSC